MVQSILIFEDNDLLRESIVSMLSLSEKFGVVGSYGDVQNIVSHVQSLQPACILMDIDMPGMTGIEAVTLLRKQNINIPIIMLTIFDDTAHVLKAIQAGATGYILKKHISTKLYDSIEEALTGGAPMSPAIARMVINSIQKKDENPYYLTGREKEILAALSQGNSYKMIAVSLTISLETVRTHIKKVYEKLHVHSQTEAVSKAIHEKLV